MLLRQIRVIRIQNNLTQQQLADVLGVSRSTYCGYESGRRNPDIEVLSKLSKFYRLPVNRFFEDVLPEFVHDPSFYNCQKDMRYVSQLSPLERQFITNFRMLTKAQKKELIEVMKEKRNENVK